MYQDLAATLKEYARLERDPLAIYLTKKLPEGTEKVEGSVAFCKIFDMARDDGKCYHARAADKDNGREKAENGAGREARLSLYRLKPDEVFKIPFILGDSGSARRS